ncbi:hypothetical protein HanXRQr2_Chr02g0080281 [Helianthus annuus]|uniref:Uncharacterized protein n=1 Tax=Helianthus annuus TaxID=4232 RepID=A0A9K3JR14_HELAN|nr:hypothetical protein HanXRQr2_Chr02g0080281 [Helianthus annuus]
MMIQMVAAVMPREQKPPIPFKPHFQRFINLSLLSFQITTSFLIMFGEQLSFFSSY